MSRRGINPYGADKREEVPTYSMSPGARIVGQIVDCIEGVQSNIALIRAISESATQELLAELAGIRAEEVGVDPEDITKFPIVSSRIPYRLVIARTAAGKFEVHSARSPRKAVYQYDAGGHDYSTAIDITPPK